MKKRCPWKEGHPPCPINFSERLCEKEVNPQLTTVFAHAMIASP